MPQNPPPSACVTFYRRELERRRDYLRHRWWKSGLPLLALGIPMVILGTGSPGPPLHPWRNALPFLLVLATWVVTFFAVKKKLGRENLQQEIEDLRALEAESH